MKSTNILRIAVKNTANRATERFLVNSKEKRHR